MTDGRAHRVPTVTVARLVHDDGRESSGRNDEILVLETAPEGGPRSDHVVVRVADPLRVDRAIEQVGLSGAVPERPIAAASRAVRQIILKIIATHADVRS